VHPAPLRTLATALLGSAVALSSACSDPEPQRDPGRPSQQVVYRVDDTSTDTIRVTTQVHQRDGHYRARLTTLEGAPPGGKSLGGVAWDSRRQYLIRADGAAESVQDVAPGFTGADSNLDVALASAVTHGLVRRAGSDEVAGTACALWLSKEPLDTSTWALPTAIDTTRSCVSADGRLLRDEWTLGGRLVRTRTAVSVGDGPSLEGDRLLGGQSPGPLPTTAPLEQTKEVAAEQLVQALGIPLPQPPTGFRLDRSTAVLQQDRVSPTAVEGGVLTFTSGDALVVLRLERGLGQRLTVRSVGVPVALGGRKGWLDPGLLGLRLSFAGGQGLVVTVTADLPEAELLAWAGSFRLP